MKPRNEPVGEVACPLKDCKRTAKVFRFRPRGAPERKTVFSGKHYLECPDHGRIGADGNTNTNEYVLRNATLWTPGPASADASRKETSTAPAPAPARSEQSRGTAGAENQPARTAVRGWRTLIDLEE